MYQIKNKTIDANMEVIIESLRDFILERDNKLLFKDIKPDVDNIMITCPFHKHGEERRPSCGISIKDKVDGDKRYPAGTVHCFTCKYTASLDSFISKVLGFEDSGEEGRKWLLDNFDVSSNRNIQVSFGGRGYEKTYQQQLISNDLLKEFRFYHPYMFKRGLTEEIINKYDIGYDKYSDCITFPVRDIKGNCLFIAKRSVKGKMFILPSARNKPLYGVYELDYNKPDIFICESFFNALTLVKWGYNAIALMGTGSNYQYELINKLPFRTIRICLDGDLAGRLGTKKLLENIDSNKLVYAYNMFDGKDVNDLTLEEFLTVPTVRR